jgi:hypothetical protein
LNRDDLKISEEGSVGSAVSNKDELNLGEDEAVAAPMLAHSMMDGCKATEVLDTLDVTLNTHTSVEAVKATDQTDNTGSGLTTKHSSCSGGLPSGVGNEEKIVHAISLRRHRKVQRTSRRHGQG